MKYKNLFLMFFLIIAWSFLFALYKYFFWGIFVSETITLQYISGYLAIGTLVAYFVWGVIFEIFKENKFHLLIALSSIFILGGMYLSTISWLSPLHIITIWTLLFWFFYGLWGILKNILIANEIMQTGLWDTKVNGWANISFITAIIVGSILWGSLSSALWVTWIIILGGILGLALVGGIFYTPPTQNQQKLSYNEIITKYKWEFLQDFVFIFKNYFMIMAFTALMITIATILSQKAIEYFVEFGGKSNASAAVILLYSAVWSIIWNILSMKMEQKRWFYFVIFGGLFSIVAFIFPHFLENFLYTSILAWIAGFVFWCSYNLIESYFFKKIWDDNKKSYGSVSLWIMVSIILSIMMFGIDFIGKYGWYIWVYYFMGGILLMISIVIFFTQSKYQ